MERVGRTEASDVAARYLEIGAMLKAIVENALPGDWDWAGRRALDFGCGAGRVLRHFAAEARQAEFAGCDIDREAIAFIQRELSPPFEAFVVEEQPGLPPADETFDVAWAFSVFTHLTDHWAGWLLELHRVLKPDGYLITSFLGAAMAQQLLGESWREGEVGMNVVAAGRTWDEGGPFVFHSEWWLRERFGRAFEVVDISQGGDGHGMLVLRKRAVTLTTADLERPAPDDPREVAALRHNIEQLHAEDGRLRAQARQSAERVEQLENEPWRRAARRLLEPARRARRR